MAAVGKKLVAQPVTGRPIFMVAYSDSTRQLLRWAPTSTLGWLAGNKYGYMVERVTVSRGGAILEQQERRFLTPYALKPLRLDQFEPVADTSDMAAVAAQAIYGDDAVVEPNAEYSFFDLVNKSRAQEDQRTVGLLAADRSFAVAKMMALGFEDSTGVRGEDYIYKVYLSNALDSTLADTAFVYVKWGQATELPRPFLVKAEPQEQRKMLISWPTETFYGIYSFYRIERSLNGGQQFSSLTKDPYVSVNEVDKGMSYYLDSIPEGASAAWYRVVGLNSFGLAGPPSDTVAAILLHEQRPVPFIDSLAFATDSTLYVGWSVPKNSDARGRYSIIATRSLSSPYKSVAQGLAAGTRSATVPVSNEYLLYVRVLFKDTDGKEYLSLPRICQRGDSIPPAPPVGLKGSVDSAGVARIKWIPNAEADMLGYRVYYSFDAASEYVQATDSLCVQPKFSYQTAQKVLNRKVYFKVQAIDRRFNRSAFSKVLVLQKEDHIPPAAPVVDLANRQGDSLSLALIPSNSPDVAAHELRAELVDKPGVTALLKAYKNQPVDSLLLINAPAGRNRLTLVAIDSSGNRAASVPLTVIGSENGKGKRSAAVSHKVENGVLIFTLSKEAPEFTYAIIYLTNAETGHRTMVTRLTPDGFPYAYGTLAINTKLTFTVSLLLSSGSTKWETITVNY